MRRQHRTASSRSRESNCAPEIPSARYGSADEPQVPQRSTAAARAESEDGRRCPIGRGRPQFPSTHVLPQATTPVAAARPAARSRRRVAAIAPARFPTDAPVAAVGRVGRQALTRGLAAPRIWRSGFFWLFLLLMLSFNLAASDSSLQRRVVFFVLIRIRNRKRRERLIELVALPHIAAEHGG